MRNPRTHCSHFAISVAGALRAFRGVRTACAFRVTLASLVGVHTRGGVSSVESPAHGVLIGEEGGSGSPDLPLASALASAQMRSTSASNSSPPSVGVSKSRTDPVSHIGVFFGALKWDNRELKTEN